MPSPRPSPPAPRDSDAEWERERVYAAVLDEVEARGLEDLTLAAVAARAGLREERLRAEFADAHACFHAAFEQRARRVYSHMLSAYATPGESWERRMRLALEPLVYVTLKRPRVVRAGLCECPSRGADARGGQAPLTALFAEAFAEMLRDAPNGHVDAASIEPEAAAECVLCGLRAAVTDAAEGAGAIGESLPAALLECVGIRDA
jgi:AcrR family transcriptional regulator